MKYWNPYLETLPREEFNRIELSYFRNLLSYAKEHSVLYREKLKHIRPDDIKTLDDVKKIPLTDKDEMRKYQEMEPFPYGGLLGSDIGKVTTFRQTSGTTGKPVYVPETYESWQWRIEAWCHILYMAGFRPHHRVFLPFGYNVYVAFWEAHFASEKVGCELIPGGALDTKGRIHKILEIRANGMMNTPTYGLHIAEEPKSLGKHNLLSDIPVHREQNPAGAIFFPPYDAHALAEAMYAMYSPRGWRASASTGTIPSDSGTKSSKTGCS